MKKIIFIHFVLILLFLSCSLPPKNNDTKYNPKISLNNSINKTYKIISDSVHIMYKNKNNKLVQIKNHDRDLYWYVILYKNKERKYKTISVVDFRQEYTRFFNLK